MWAVWRTSKSALSLSYSILVIAMPCMLTGYRTGVLGGKNAPFIFIVFFLSVVAG